MAENDNNQITDSGGIHIATVITAPPDDCPNCLTHQNPPYWSSHQSDKIIGRYTCPQCDYYWTSKWRAENIT
jgi:predicted RNA-binding Zn-ribbon protein involved in translation (DUF1610 family)